MKYYLNYSNYPKKIGETNFNIENIKNKFNTFIRNFDKFFDKITYNLDKPELGLIIQPNHLQWMEHFSSLARLLILASEFYVENDYMHEN